MKNPLLIFFLALALGAGVGVWITQTWISPSGAPAQVRLEEVLVVKELHLVRHHYNDLFFLHRKNDNTRAVRAIAEVPVTITAFLNLKDMQWVKRNDSIVQVILPKAQLDNPSYAINQMEIKETRGFQLHVGGDLYPKVSRYLGEIIAQRLDTIRHRALANNILIQAEAEGKQYVEQLLRGIGRTDVGVSFSDELEDKAVALFTSRLSQPPDSVEAWQDSVPGTLARSINNVLYGWIPVD